MTRDTSTYATTSISTTRPASTGSRNYTTPPRRRRRRSQHSSNSLSDSSKHSANSLLLLRYLLYIDYST